LNTRGIPGSTRMGNWQSLPTATTLGWEKCF
jgi:hypothetical protein